jgi:hypothetical protein
MLLCPEFRYLVWGCVFVYATLHVAMPRANQGSDCLISMELVKRILCRCGLGWPVFQATALLLCLCLAALGSFGLCGEGGKQLIWIPLLWLHLHCSWRSPKVYAP